MQPVWAFNPEPLLPVFRHAIEVLGLVSLLQWMAQNPLYVVAALVVAALAVGVAAKS